MKIANRLYLVRAISGCGDWLTLLALALLVKERFGGDKVAYSFLVGSLPTLLLSGVAGRIVGIKARLPLYIACLVALAVNVIALFGADSLWRIYIYLFVAGTLTTLSRPLFDSLVGGWIEAKERQVVLTRMGGIMAGLLAFAPAAGGFLATAFGFNVIFAIDALSFIAAAFLVYPMRNAPVLEIQSTEALAGTHVPSAKKEANAPFWKLWQCPERHFSSELRKVLLGWYLVLVVGALINGVEYAAFEKFQYSKNSIGLINASWGLGGLAAFFLAKRLAKVKQIAWELFLYIAALVIFLCVGLEGVSYASFFVAGFGSVTLGGHFRAKIQAAIPVKANSFRVWALVNSRLSLINVITYGGVGLLLPHLPLSIFAAAFVGIGIALLVTIPLNQKSF